MLFLFGSTSEFAGGQSVGEMYKAAVQASKEAVKALTETVTHIQDSALKIQRSMTNIKLDDASAAKFQLSLENVFKNTLVIGGTFKDVTENLSNFSASLESAMMPSENTMQSMVEMAKATGIANAEIGKAVGELTKFTFSQTRALELMNNITKTARMAGADAKTVIAEVTTNLVKTDSLGFRNGVEGLTKMAVQAKVLKTSISDIGVMKLSQTLWDPSKAIELAQNMQMYGGQVGAMGNAFEVFRMGAYDAEKLQDEMIKVTAQAFHMNEQTGKIETSFLSRQQLKAQAEAMGMDYEKAVQIGKEKFKQLEIEKKLTENAEVQRTLKSGGLSPEIMQLMTSMSELKKDAATGKMVMSLNIPGMTEIADLEKTLSDPTKTTALVDQMKQYQQKASMSDKEIAQANMSINEKQAVDVKEIRDMMYLNLSISQRNDLKVMTEELRKMAETTGQGLAAGRGTAAYAKIGLYVGGSGGYDATGDRRTIMDEQSRTMNNENDYFLGSGEKEIRGGKGDFRRRLIPEDEIVAFPEAGKTIDQLAKFYNDTKSYFKNSMNDFGAFFSKIDNESLPKIDTPKNISLENRNKDIEKFERNIVQRNEMIVKNEPIEVKPISIELTVNGDNKKVKEAFDDINFKQKVKDMVIGQIAASNKKGYGEQKNMFAK